MLNVLLVVGTRPEIIKMAPVVRALSAQASRVSFKVCLTSQHRELAKQALRIFDISPDFDLDVMTPNQSPSQVAAAVLERVEPILKSERPDWILVQGDTTSVLAASLAAFYSRIRVGHVEAGLRTHARDLPFPEEIQRRMVSLAANLHFAPTERARACLLKEDVAEANIIVTGNTVVDAVQWIASMPVNRETRSLLAAAGNRRLVLVTTHRRESFGEQLETVCRAVRDVSQIYADRIFVIFPVHANPNVRGPVYRMLSGLSNVRLTGPLDYVTFVHLLKQSFLVLTDSGGVQEEAPSFGIPVLVLRDVTERPENIENGAAKLVGCNRLRIVDETRSLMDNPLRYNAMSKAVYPYGDGRAGKRIVSVLMDRPLQGRV